MLRANEAMAVSYTDALEQAVKPFDGVTVEQATISVG
jgi:hypothetical protein